MALNLTTAFLPRTLPPPALPSNKVNISILCFAASIPNSWNWISNPPSGRGAWRKKRPQSSAGNLPEEGPAPAILQRCEGVLQRGAGADDWRDPKGVRRRCVVREPSVLPREPYWTNRRGRSGREVQEEVRWPDGDYADSYSERWDCASVQAQDQ